MEASRRDANAVFPKKGRLNGWPNHVLLRWAAALLFVSLFSQPVLANIFTTAEIRFQADVRVLERGVKIERELKGDDAHAYHITIGAGQYLHLTVDQRGVDVALKMLGPDGSNLIEVDS